MTANKKIKKVTLLITTITLLCLFIYINISHHLFLVFRLNYRLTSVQNFDFNNQGKYKPLVKNSKEITLVGESHGMEKTYIFLGNLIKAMNEQNKLNYLVIETSPSESAIINLYLTTGDTNYLLEFISDNIGTPLASQEFINIIKTVKAINENRKIPIRFIGVDAEWKEKTLLYYLKREFQQFSDNQYFKEIWLRVSKATTISPKECKEILNLIIANQGKLPLKDEDIFDIKMALTQRYSEQDITSSEVMLFRDKKMEECFMSYKEYLPRGYFLVDMGSDHISNNKYKYKGKKVESFGSLLKQENNIQNQLYTINLEYLDSQSMYAEDIGKKHSVSTLPYYTFLKLKDKIIYPNTKAFNRIQEWNKFESGEADYHMPSVIIILVSSKAVNCTNISFKPK